MACAFRFVYQSRVAEKTYTRRSKKEKERTNHINIHQDSPKNRIKAQKVLCTYNSMDKTVGLVQACGART